MLNQNDFSQKSVKELIEYNLKREGPILEGNENFMFYFKVKFQRWHSPI